MARGQSISGGVSVDGKPLEIIKPDGTPDAEDKSGLQTLADFLMKLTADAVRTLKGRESRQKLPDGDDAPDHKRVKILLQSGDWEVTRTDHEAPKGRQVTTEKFSI